MNECLRLKESNCKNCYKCIRYCPVKAISFSSDQANIVQDECILCGQCFVICPQNAKSIRSDVETAKELIAGGGPVYASIAPSFVANYSGATMASMREALAKLGFAGAEETALGATIVKRKYEDMIRSGEHDVIISSCCHSVNLLIQKYHPGALPYLAKVVSPMQAHCDAIKRQHPGAKTVFIGPCLSKKDEAEQYPGSVDCVLTYEELSAWMAEEGVVLERDGGETSGKAGLFPTAGGILRSMEKNRGACHYIAIDGIDNCLAALKNIENGELSGAFIEMSACIGSCIGGPVMDHNRPVSVSGFIAVDKRAARCPDFQVEMPEANTLSKVMDFQAIHRRRMGRSAVEDVMRKMGKTQPADELNCGSCGYNTCREKAEAILAGKADMSMCLPYLMARAQSFSDTIIRNTPNGIIVLDEWLRIQQINDAACDIANIRDQKDVLGREVTCVLDPTPFVQVLQSRQDVVEQKIFLVEYQRYVMLTVIYDESYRVMICLLRDVTESETSRSRKEERSRKTIEITDKVIAKQMRAVQEIASLLGETTAETKVALTKLKETLSDE